MTPDNGNTIYQWSSSEKYAGYLGVSDSDERAMCWNDSVLGDPLPALADWKPPTLRQYLGEKGKRRKPAPIGDAPGSASIRLISEQAADALQDVWERHAELYPVVLEDAPKTNYYMVVVKTELPFEALDRQRSKGVEVLVGPRVNTGLFAVIEDWVFDPAHVQDHFLFTTPDSRTRYFVTERFRKRLEASTLKGFCLRTHFWDENPWLS